MQPKAQSVSLVLTSNPKSLKFSSNEVGPKIVTVKVVDLAGQLVPDTLLTYEILNSNDIPPAPGIFKTANSGTGKSSPNNATLDIKIELATTPTADETYSLDVSSDSSNTLRIPIALETAVIGEPAPSQCDDSD